MIYWPLHSTETRRKYRRICFISIKINIFFFSSVPFNGVDAQATKRSVFDSIESSFSAEGIIFFIFNDSHKLTNDEIRRI